MKYEVIEFFTDLQDGGHMYNVGDTYPRRGLKPAAKRIDELSTSRNRRGEPLIRAVDEAKETAPSEAE